jgi:hypothetical protein
VLLGCFPSERSRALSSEPSGVAVVALSRAVDALSPRDRLLVDAVAERVLEVMSRQEAERRSGGLVDAAELARLLGVSTSWVYANAGELGAVRLGSGSRPRLRFDPDVARAAGDRLASGMSQGDSASVGGSSEPSPRPRRRRSPNGAPKPPGSILGSRPRGGA